MRFIRYDIAGMLAALVFAVLYTAITFEKRLKADKTPLALIGGAAIWIIAAMTDLSSAEFAHAQEVSDAEIGSILLFLLKAMVIVAGLSILGLFDWAEMRLMKLGFTDRRLASGFLPARCDGSARAFYLQGARNTTRDPLACVRPQQPQKRP